jgi:hypothetical protein
MRKLRNRVEKADRASKEIAAYQSKARIIKPAAPAMNNLTNMSLIITNIKYSQQLRPARVSIQLTLLPDVFFFMHAHSGG